MCCGWPNGSTCGSQAEVLTTFTGLFALPYAPLDLPLISLERAGGGGCICWRKHLFPVSHSEKVMGHAETSQRGWIQPTGPELDHTELVKTMWTQLVWHIPLLTCIKYQFVHATGSSPSQLQFLCDHLMISFLITRVLKYYTLTRSYWHVKSFF